MVSLVRAALWSQLCTHDSLRAVESATCEGRNTALIPKMNVHREEGNKGGGRVRREMRRLVSVCV